jgi:Holliday junction resolvase RusA-like endonuclease
MRITLRLPPRALSPNARVHWGARVRTTRRYRNNLLASLKPAFDGLADASVVADDSGMIHMPVEQHMDRDDPRVEIVVEGAA